MHYVPVILPPASWHTAEGETTKETDYKLLLAILEDLRKIKKHLGVL